MVKIIAILFILWISDYINFDSFIVDTIDIIPLVYL